LSPLNPNCPKDPLPQEKRKYSNLLEYQFSENNLQLPIEILAKRLYSPYINIIFAITIIETENNILSFEII
jgi:hypothetical protein